MIFFDELLNSSILLRSFISRFIGKIVLEFSFCCCCNFVWPWYQGTANIIKTFVMFPPFLTWCSGETHQWIHLGLDFFSWKILITASMSFLVADQFKFFISFDIILVHNMASDLSIFWDVSSLVEWIHTFKMRPNDSLNSTCICYSGSLFISNFLYLIPLLACLAKGLFAILKNLVFVLLIGILCSCLFLFHFFCCKIKCFCLG